VSWWVEPGEFEGLVVVVRELGFAGVMSGPLLRSSYRVGRLYVEAVRMRDATGAELWR
jgi:lipoic acid synthetase